MFRILQHDIFVSFYTEKTVINITCLNLYELFSLKLKKEYEVLIMLCDFILLVKYESKEFFILSEPNSVFNNILCDDVTNVNFFRKKLIK